MESKNTSRVCNGIAAENSKRYVHCHRNSLFRDYSARRCVATVDYSPIICTVTGISKKSCKPKKTTLESGRVLRHGGSDS